MTHPISQVPGLLLAIARKAEERGAVMPGNAQLAAALGVHRATISTNLIALVESGAIKLTPAGAWKRWVRVFEKPGGGHV